ncbi:MAG: hypothetical protein EOO75_15795, partial [Myxococcales bacterium]
MAERTILGPGSFIRGLIRGDGDIEIAGQLEGEVDVTGDVVIQPSATIKASLRGARVIIRGAVSGDVSARAAILLESGARVVGSLAAPSIGIGEGALIRGRVETGADAGPAAQRPAGAQRETPRAAPRAEA